MINFLLRWLTTPKVLRLPEWYAIEHYRKGSITISETSMGRGYQVYIGNHCVAELKKHSGTGETYLNWATGNQEIRAEARKLLQPIFDQMQADWDKLMVEKDAEIMGAMKK